MRSKLTRLSAVEYNVHMYRCQVSFLCHGRDLVRFREKSKVGVRATSKNIGKNG